MVLRGRGNAARPLTFIWAENVREEILQLIVQLTLQYILYTSKIKEPELMELTQALPAKHRRRAKTTGEIIEARGYKRGKAEGEKLGMEKGMELILRHYLIKRPQDNDEGVAQVFSVPADWVKKVRRAIQEERN
jgi:hypothetical protein